MYGDSFENVWDYKFVYKCRDLWQKGHGDRYRKITRFLNGNRYVIASTVM